MSWHPLAKVFASAGTTFLRFFMLASAADAQQTVQSSLSEQACVQKQETSSHQKISHFGDQSLLKSYCYRFHAGEAAYKASCVETSEHPPVQAVQVSEKRVSTISRSSFCWNWSLSWECVGQKSSGFRALSKWNQGKGCSCNCLLWQCVWHSFWMTLIVRAKRLILLVHRSHHVVLDKS